MPVKCYQDHNINHVTVQYNSGINPILNPGRHKTPEKNPRAAPQKDYIFILR